MVFLVEYLEKLTWYDYLFVITTWTICQYFAKKFVDWAYDNIRKK